MDTKREWTLVPSWVMLAQVAHISMKAIAMVRYRSYVVALKDITFLDIWCMCV